MVGIDIYRDLWYNIGVIKKEVKNMDNGKYTAEQYRRKVKKAMLREMKWWRI